MRGSLRFRIEAWAAAEGSEGSARIGEREAGNGWRKDELLDIDRRIVPCDFKFEHLAGSCEEDFFGALQREVRDGRQPGNQRPGKYFACPRKLWRVVRIVDRAAARWERALPIESGFRVGMKVGDEDGAVRSNDANEFRTTPTHVFAIAQGKGHQDHVGRAIGTGRDVRIAQKAVRPISSTFRERHATCDAKDQRRSDV